ncbi:MAG: FtsX-like permease family protein, partial [Candidatus Aminicenantes bacterium]|nr:FtsX-like permease family protein [Candidatus Aminicenantes bacterium]
IESFVRFWRRQLAVKDQNNTYHMQQLIMTENSIFDIFDYELEKGDPKAALTNPMAAVLTRKTAQKYLRENEVIGKTLTIEFNGEKVDFQITGILKEVPKNSHIQFDMLISSASQPEQSFTNWDGNFLYTYVLLNDKSSKHKLEQQFEAFLNKYVGPVFANYFGEDKKISDVLRLRLIPVTGIHLNPRTNWEIEPQGSMSSVYIFSFIAILILFIACMNFMNLSTARANKRAKEVGLRKTIGAYRNQLKIQFIEESLLLALIGLLFAVLLIVFAIPLFNSIFDETLSWDMLLHSKNLLIILGITLVTGLLSGLYPAFYMSRFEPAKVFKGGGQSGKGRSSFRKYMAVIQFVISITLIFGTLTVLRQMNFIQTLSLGFDKENVIVFPVRSNSVRQGLEAFRNDLTGSSKIIRVSGSNKVPGDQTYGDHIFTRKDNSEDVDLIFLGADFDFIDTYDMDILEGRNFSRNFSTDRQGTLILNEAAVQKIGLTPAEAMGKELYSTVFETTGQIVGIVKNFNFKSLRREIEPIVIMLFPDSNRIDNISVRIVPGNVKETIGFIEQRWAKFFPGDQFEFNFLDSRLDRLYQNEEKMKNIFIVFSALSIFVACLGLFGVAAYTAAERTKEIGVRKVLGASSTSVFLLLTKDFTKWVILANIAALPLGFFMLNKWLQNFAYRINIGWHVFLLSALIAFIMALVAVFFQAVKATVANPVTSLKYE